ncbi:MAG TPA: phosphate ABC transporter substrate-binding protein [Burkholderiales bacterium]|nr:phosphate ABC transporter substrate-binding protein [Burkholderiales bacterium]
MSALKLKTLLGDYPATEALKKGRVPSASVALEFADIRPPSSGFKRVVRGLEFDVAELAITTFLMAKAAGKPYRLLPAVMVGRLQHSFLVHNAERGPLAPRDLAGRRVGVRSYSVTTGMWIRGILAEDHGVDPDRITWVTFEEAHVAEFRDPPNVERAAPGKDVIGMLLAGEIDAAIVGDGKPADSRIRPLIPDPEAAARAWRARTGAIQINHMVAVKDSVPDKAAAEVSRMLEASIKAAGSPDMNPFGIEANRRNLEVAIDYVYRQRLIPTRYTVEELFR